MVKKKQAESKKSATPQLTEWQRRNLEFQKKKRQQALEEKQIREKLLQEKLPKKKKEPEKDIVKPKKIKTRKKIKSKKDYRSLPVFVVSGLVFLISLFLLTPFSRQKTLTVTGVTHTVESTVISASKITTETYLTDLILHKEKFQANIVKNDPWVKEVTITYQFPNRFVIKVKENKIIAYSQTQKGTQPIIETGQIMDSINSSELPSSYLLINLSGKNKIKKVIQSLEKLKSSLYENISSISSANSKTTTDLLTLEMKDGNTVRVPLSSLDKKLPYYSQMVSNIVPPAIIDMEVGLYSTTDEIESSSSSSSDTEGEKDQSNPEQNSTLTEEQEITEQSSTESTYGIQ